MATLEQIMKINTLNQCAMECTKQSRWKDTTQRYLSDMLLKNLDLQEEVLAGKYKVKPTTDFYLNERGHVRKIEAPAIRDRIVQKTLMKNVLLPSLVPCLIYDNYASLKDRGTSFARKRFDIMLHRYVRKHGLDGYILLIDIKKYFENIDHDVLKQLIAPKIDNEPDDVKRLIHYVIDSSSKTNKGLNLGSEAPQIFAVYYLNPIDTFVKAVKGVKYYGRYMDDIFIIGQSKEELSLLLNEIRQRLSDLRLEINDKKTCITKLSHGFTFLQVKYHILQTGRIVKSMSHGKVARERRRLRAFRRMMDKGQMTEGEVYNCYQSWRGTQVIDHNACYKSIKSMDALYRKLFPPHVDPPKQGRREIAISINRNAESEDLVTLYNIKRKDYE